MKLLSMERIVVIESVTITREAGAKDINASIALNISGSAYYLADKAQLENQLRKIKEKINGKPRRYFSQSNILSNRSDHADYLDRVDWRVSVFCIDQTERARFRQNTFRTS